MDERVKRLKTPQECERFAKNVIERHPDLAQEARRRAVELRASAHGARSDVEIKAYQAIYAYEEALTAKKGRRTRASRTWQMVKRHGIIGTMERLVKRKDATTGYTTLAEMHMLDLAFEAVVLSYPNLFSPEAVERSKQRLEEWDVN
jgi:hypothetical protein